MAQKERSLAYVTKDIERALGIEPRDGYFVIAGLTPYAETAAAEHPDNVWLIGSGDPQSTFDLLNDKKVAEYIEHHDSDLIVFKNTPQIESLAKEKGWHLLNPPAALSEKIENKLSQVEWLGEIGDRYLPEHKIVKASDISWEKKPFIVQWEHGHTGESTVLIDSKKALSAIQEKFPERNARLTGFIDGHSFTVNAVVTPSAILMGNISYQITGLEPFTDNRFTTVGNDWSAAHTMLSDAEIAEAEAMVENIGKKLQAESWRGLFGIDFMREHKAGRIYLIEINARQPASAVFESFLQKRNHREGLDGLTVFEAHLQALQGTYAGGALIPINDGAQIVQRVTKSVTGIPDEAPGSLELAGYMVVGYANTRYNSDLMRIQSLQGIVDGGGKLNSRGKEIVDMI